METRVQRALQNRWLATAATIAVAYIGVRVMFWVLEDAYYNYYLYPQIKGAEYNYPELRYTFGQVAIFLWSFMGLCTAALVGRCTLLRTEDKWAARSAIAFVLGFVLLVVGFVAGMAMRDLGVLTSNPLALTIVSITLIDPANRLVSGKMGEQTAQACANALISPTDNFGRT